MRPRKPTLLTISTRASHQFAVRETKSSLPQDTPHYNAFFRLKYYTMGPPKPPVPHVAPIYRLTATALGAGMWFWLMYRAKKDGPVLMGWKHPWDH
ncbi:hypothetical protein X797_002790 [Metarhizium robertsii]|nr:hypothetical protein X797_002790 [Metarhizium robertsii]